ncbi:head-tail connector protein [Limosilactobacillus antri]|uniref:head-tail connector protein n=1 Tax=Limosilactobacillus antri TaxID=227943 RepID=UPI001F59ADFF|nr:head-tail connector protein [Limosilactobacillus antri]
MADENNENQLINPEDLLEELNLDSTPENNTVVGGLIQSAQELVLDSVNQNLSASDVNADKIYIRAVKALATALYFDRTLSQGMPLGVQIMITHLKGRYAEWPQKSNNGK